MTLAAYVAALTTTAYVEAVGNRLPDMPLFLDEDHYISMPLETTYEETWASCPEDMRALVEGGFDE